jgi:hypothetical protein
MSVSATDLWPVDLVPQELITPHQILMMQADALNARMEGLVTAEVKSVVIEDNGDSRTSLRFEIYSAVETRRVKLFEAAHRIDHSYPVALHGPDRLPAFLRERGRALTLNELYLVRNTA